MLMECVDLLEIPPFIYVSTTLWGNRCETLNVYSQKTYGRPNPYFIKPSILSNKPESMKRSIYAAMKVLENSETDEKWFVFLLTSLVAAKDSKKKILHTNVLVSKHAGDEDPSCKWIYKRFSLKHYWETFFPRLPVRTVRANQILLPDELRVNIDWPDELPKFKTDFWKSEAINGLPAPVLRLDCEIGGRSGTS